MEPDQPQSTPKPSSLRWQILRRALLRRPSNSDNPSEKVSLDKVSRRTKSGFNLIPCHVVNDGNEDPESLARRDICFYYTLPLPNAPKLCLRNKRVIELGSGYGLAGFVIAMVTEALEVVISDGNPQVVDYIQHNIISNSAALGSTKMKSMILHWDQHEVSDIYGTFDIIVASDCTFFKKFHKGLARTIRCLLKEHGPSEAILFSPKRGDSLGKFLVEVEASGLHFTITETYDAEIWRRHKNITNCDHSWPNYESDHCYPLLISITRLFVYAEYC